MMNSKELCQIWMPSEESAWTIFAERSLFANEGDVDELPFNLTKIPSIPPEITRLHNGQTAIIVDLPGTVGVKIGLGLANEGFRPVPLYRPIPFHNEIHENNELHEAKIDKLDNVIKNQPIVNALVLSASILRDLEIDPDAPPAFLLDYDRNKVIDDHVDTVDDHEEVTDDRWRLNFETLPEASYLISNKIKRLVVWTKHKMNRDLEPIINSYRDAGVEILIFTNGRITYHGSSISEPTREELIKSKEWVRRFENARFSLFVLTILAFANLFGRFFINEVPLLWTAPSVQWLTYLWVSRSLGDLIAIMIPFIYLLLYLNSPKKRYLLLVAFIFFSIDVIIYIYAFFIGGVSAFIGNYWYFGLITFMPSVLFIIFLIRGLAAWKKLISVDEIAYLAHLDQLDGTKGTALGITSGRGKRRRGYRGYGGTSR